MKAQFFALYPCKLCFSLQALGTNIELFCLSVVNDGQFYLEGNALFTYSGADT
jgi:hypothetical protein